MNLLKSIGRLLLGKHGRPPPSPSQEILQYLSQISCELDTPGGPERIAGICLNILREQPGLVEAETLLALSYARQGRYGDAAPLIRRSREAGIQSLQLSIAYSYLLIAEGNFDGALQALDQAERSHPSHPLILEMQAGIFSYLGMLEKAFDCHSNLLTMQPDSILRHLQWIESLRKLKRPRYDESIGRFVSMFLQLPQRSAAESLSYAESLYQVSGQDKVAERLIQESLQQAHTPDSQGNIVHVRWRSIESIAQEAQAEILNNFEPVARGTSSIRPIILAWPHIAILPALQWIPWHEASGSLAKEFQTTRLRTFRESPSHPLLTKGSSNALLLSPQKVFELKESAVILGGAHAYYHHFIDYIGRYALVESTPELDNLPLVIEDKLPPFAQQWFDLMGAKVSSRKIIRCPSDVVLKGNNLVTPTPLSLGGKLFHPRLVDWFRSVAGRPRQAKRRLYLTRRHTEKRRLVNEKDLFNAIEQFGFEMVAPEKLPLQEQIALFSEAEYIVGPVGAAFANMVFMPPGGGVITIANEFVLRGRADRYFDALADAANLRYAQVPARGENPEARRLLDADISIDVSSFKKTLYAMLDGNKY